MNSNQRRMEIELKKYRKELKAMINDIEDIDIKVLNKAVNVGLAEAKRITPVGKSRKGYVGGFMRRSWAVSPTRQTSSGVEKELFNTAEYATYVNYGHRIVRNGATLGFVKGKFILERAVNKIENTMVNEFRKAVEEVNRKHDK